VRRLRLWLWLGAMAVVAACGGIVVACGGASASKPNAEIKTSFHAPPDVLPKGIHKIRHVVIIMQENRSFDSYFGDFSRGGRDPGASREPRQGAMYAAVCGGSASVAPPRAQAPSQAWRWAGMRAAVS
jgi:phospholipase C